MITINQIKNGTPFQYKSGLPSSNRMYKIEWVDNKRFVLSANDLKKKEVLSLSQVETIIMNHKSDVFDSVQALWESPDTTNNPHIKWHTRELENGSLQLYNLFGVDWDGTEFIASAYWDGQNDPDIFNIEER